MCPIAAGAAHLHPMQIIIRDRVIGQMSLVEEIGHEVDSFVVFLSAVSAATVMRHRC